MRGACWSLEGGITLDKTENPLPHGRGPVSNDPALVLDLIEAFRRSKTIFAAVELGVFDGVRPAGVAIERLLEACVALGLLEKRDGEFVNSAVADEYLRSSSPRSLAGYVRYSNKALYPMWGDLEGAVIEGSVIQPLRLVAPDNSVQVALYTMQKQPNGRWKISGCVLAPSTVQAA